MSAALLLSACASMVSTERIDASTDAKLRKVAVVSLLGREYVRQYVGFTVFNNEREELTAPEWRLDRTFVEQMSTAARGLKRFDVVDAAPDPASISDTGFLQSPLSFGEPRWSALQPAIKAHAARTGADAVLVAVPTVRGEYGMSNQSAIGTGTFVRGLLGGQAYAASVAHAFGEVGLFDADGRILSVRRLSMNQSGHRAADLNGMPTAAVSPSMGRKPHAGLSEAERQTILEPLSRSTRLAFEVTIASFFPERR